MISLLDDNIGIPELWQFSPVRMFVFHILSENLSYFIYFSKTLNILNLNILVSFTAEITVWSHMHGLTSRAVPWFISLGLYSATAFKLGIAQQLIYHILKTLLFLCFQDSLCLYLYVFLCETHYLLRIWSQTCGPQAALEKTTVIQVGTEHPLKHESSDVPCITLPRSERSIVLTNWSRCILLWVYLQWQSQPLVKVLLLISNVSV